MKLEVENISENESILNFIFEKKDYIDDLKNGINLIKNNINRNGFRGKNTPTNILYKEFGNEVINKIIDKKITEEFKKIEEYNKKKDNIMFNPILIESTFPQKKLTENINEIKDFNLKFIYCHLKKISFETIKEKLSDIKISSLFCSELNDKNLIKISAESALIYITDKEKKRADNNDILEVLGEDNQKLYIPCKCIINDNQIDLTGKHITEVIELNLEEDIKFSDEIFNLINYNYTKSNKNRFKIVKIFSKSNINIDKVTSNVIEKLSLEKSKENAEWINDFLNIEIPNFESNITKNYNNVLAFQNIRDIALFQCNLALEDITNFEIKSAIIDKFEINIPTYIEEKVKKMVNENNKLKNEIGTIIKNEIILENIKETLIEKYNLNCSKEDIVSYLNINSVLRNTGINNLEKKYFENKLKNKFLISKDSYEEIILEKKAICEIKKLLNIKKKEITYDDFLNISN